MPKKHNWIFKTEGKKIKNIMIVLIFLLIVGVIVVNVRNKIITTNAIKEQERQKAYEDWLVDNCECLEKERIKCKEGFELINGVCKNKTRKVFTNVLEACSKYYCDGEIHVFNLEEGKWEK